MKSLLSFIFLCLLLSGAAFLAADEKQLGAYLGAKPAEYPAWFKDSFLDFQDDIEEAAANGKRVLLIFHQDNCPYCAELVEQNLAQKHIADKLQTNFDVIALNMWGDREVVTVDGNTFTEKSFAAALKVQFTPTLLFFTEDARLALRLNGYLAPDKFLQALNYVSSKGEKQGSFRQYLEKHLPQASVGKFNQQPFFADLKKYQKKSEAKPVAVFFEQKHCPNCDVLHQKTIKDEGTLELLQAFDNFQVDMWSNDAIVSPWGKATTARGWAKDLNVQYAPTIVLFDAQGNEIIRSEAFFKSFHTQSLFDYVLSKGYLQESNFQRWISARAEHIRETGQDVNIWE